MTRATISRRNSLALCISAIFHVLLVAVLLSGNYRPYDLPTPPSEPIQMEIERIPEPDVITPPIEQQPPPEVTPIPLEPERPDVRPPVVAPPVPTPAPPEPQPAPVVAKLRPVTATQAAKPSLPAKAAPNPTPLAPTPNSTPAPVASATPKVAQAPSAAPVPTASHLNIHKAEKDAPAGVATLPMAPAPFAARSGSPSQSAAAESGALEAGMSSSRLRGLSPFPPGSLPSGGPGLRGSLVGCANSQAVGLSNVERAHCAERFGVDVARAPHLDGMSPEKRAGFDRATAKAEAWRTYRDSIPANGTDPGPNGMGRLGAPTPDSVLETIPH